MSAQSNTLLFDGPDLNTDGDYSVTINQNLISSDEVVLVMCLRPQRVTGDITYSLLNGEEYVTIDDSTGSVTLQIDALNFPVEDTYMAVVQCSIMVRSETLRNNTNLNIHYSLENEYAPTFTHTSSLVISIVEIRNIIEDPHVITLNATDQDLGEPGEIIYEVWSVNEEGVFDLDSETGRISLISSLDYETAREYVLRVRASNPRLSGLEQKFAYTSVRIMVQDINDEPPVFNQIVYDVTFNENTQPQDFIQMSCTDPDTDDGDIGYVSQSQFLPFTIDIQTGFISASQQFNYEQTTSYSLAVKCIDFNDVHLSDTATVNIEILPVNEYRPERKGLGIAVVSISETTPPGTLIASGLLNTEAPVTMQFIDQDRGLDHGTVKFYYGETGTDMEIADEYFKLDTTTGNLTTIKSFDLNQCVENSEPTIIRLSITGCDIEVSSICPNIKFRIYVLPLECVPTFPHDTFEIKVNETAQVGAELQIIPCDIPGLEEENTTLAIVTATIDRDIMQSFSIDRSGRLTLQGPLDYEQRQNYSFFIYCTDSRQNQDFTVVNVNVLPENDNSPFFDQALMIFNVSVPISSTPYTIGRIEANDNDIDDGDTLIYSIEDNPYFSLDENENIVLEVLPSDPLQDTFVLEAEASDGQFTATTTILILLSTRQTISCVPDTSEQTDESDSGNIAIGVIGVLSAIIFAIVVMSIVLLVYVFYRRTHRTEVIQNGSLRIIHTGHDHQLKE